jgi:hypothetical protein
MTGTELVVGQGQELENRRATSTKETDGTSPLQIRVRKKKKN